MWEITKGGWGSVRITVEMFMGWYRVSYRIICVPVASDCRDRAIG